MSEPQLPSLVEVAKAVIKVMVQTHGSGGLDGVAQAVMTQLSISSSDTTKVLMHQAVSQGLISPQYNPFLL